MTPRWAVWPLPLLLSLHNLEEAVLFPGYLPRVLSRLPALGLMLLGRALSAAG